MATIPDFGSEPERREWFIKNAEYFTIIRRIAGRNVRAEVPTLEVARQTAKRIIELQPDARLLIYAVHGVSDIWVENVMKGRISND